MKTVLISPIKAVRNDVGDNGVDFILCTADENLTLAPTDNVLLLRFSDLTDESNPHAFQMTHAEKIRAFLRRPAAKQELFVCCDSGESRSAAVAAAVLLADGQSDERIWGSTEYHPNVLVFRRLCAALGVRLQEADVRKRKQTNDECFRRALCGGNTPPGQ